ncbi:MAG: nucleoside-diphosphate sugar epimerase/dehydratase [Clostridia bacterium]|nr:nucleoside-diphosphate sugar epimerase/dehydratase [Clostridia bacterium]
MKTGKTGRRMVLILIDLLILLVTDVLLLICYPSNITKLEPWNILLQIILTIVTVFGFRTCFRIYGKVWRYADTITYLNLIFADAAALAAYFVIQMLLPFKRLSFMRTSGLIAADLLLCIASRLIYQYLYQARSADSKPACFLRRVLQRLTGQEVSPAGSGDKTRQINIAIVGAGRVGAALAEELLSNPDAAYKPVCFVDIDPEKVGRTISGIRVLSEAGATAETLGAYPVQEIVFALPETDPEKKRVLYEHYKQTGCRLKVYDYPLAATTENGRRTMREFDIEELLFRTPQDFLDEATVSYYTGKRVLITGGGGSIGSELCRQIARMKPARLTILDVYENGAYDIQQELKIACGPQLDLHVEILSVTDREALDRVFAAERPDVVLHAAAHKHVPLMEHNCAEAVANNVFGTLNTVDAAEKYKVKKFIMVSTDKAVNPTNVMGATKRMCEMIVQSRTGGETKFSATRFGNVLGSNGSVIPLFRRQIAEGGPVTVTDKRITRYFMTIPEASQLVLTSGAMAKDGELFVLDMGEPVKILELAESMIRLTGFEPYKDIDIQEIGLRNGEKLYEELLVKSETLSRTENRKIYIEKDEPLSRQAIDEKLELLRAALRTGDNDRVREALHRCVPTFRTPEEVNAAALKEMV